MPKSPGSACSVVARTARPGRPGRPVPGRSPKPGVSNCHPGNNRRALQAIRTWYASAEGKRQYARRAGIEGTLSQGVRAFGLRRARYRGLEKTHLPPVATAAAINIDRTVAWLDAAPAGQPPGPPASPPWRPYNPFANSIRSFAPVVYSRVTSYKATGLRPHQWGTRFCLDG